MSLFLTSWYVQSDLAWRPGERKTLWGLVRILARSEWQFLTKMTVGSWCNSILVSISAVLSKLRPLYERASEEPPLRLDCYLDFLSCAFLNVVEDKTYPIVIACCSRVRKLHRVLCFIGRPKLGGWTFGPKIKSRSFRTDRHRPCPGAQLALNLMRGLSDICCRPSSYQKSLYHLKASWT